MHTLLESEFARQDPDATGLASWPHFLAAFNRVSQAHRLYLTEGEVRSLFKAAVTPGDSTADYR